jgi:hypothetical protein
MYKSSAPASFGAHHVMALTFAAAAVFKVVLVIVVAAVVEVAHMVRSIIWNKSPRMPLSPS